VLSATFFTWCDALLEGTLRRAEGATSASSSVKRPPARQCDPVVAQIPPCLFRPMSSWSWRPPRGAMSAQ